MQVYWFEVVRPSDYERLLILLLSEGVRVKTEDRKGRGNEEEDERGEKEKRIFHGTH